MMDEPIAVSVGPCRCIDAPHDPHGDVVYLAAEPSLSLGLAANGAIAAAGNDAALLETYLGRAFIDHGIVDWTFIGDDGPEAITPGNIERLLPWSRGGSAVAEKANELYGEAILRPLVARSLNLSGLGPTNGSTSVTRPSRSERRSSSKSSSPARSGIPR